MRSPFGRPIPVPSRGGNVSIWDEPLDNQRYVIGADVAEGKDRDSASHRRGVVVYSDDRPDFSAAVVIELESMIHVASYHASVSTTDYSEAIAALATHYNNAYTIVERNGPGVAVVEALHKTYRLRNLYVSKIFNHTEGTQLQTSIGWQTTTATRPLLIARIEEAIAADMVRTRDRNLLKELRSMQYDKMGVPRGIGRDKDDRVLAYGLALQARYERLLGRTHDDEVDKDMGHLDEFTRRMWQEKWRREENAKRNRSGGRSFGRGRRPRRPSRVRH